MPVIAFVGVKQGVGATTIVANLATSLALQGQQVLAIDLCDDDALRLHLGMPWDTRDGLLPRLGNRQDWRQAVWHSPEGAYFLPLGASDSLKLPSFLEAHPDWLSRQLTSLCSTSERWILIEFPACDDTRLEQTLALADEIVVVTSATPDSHVRLTEWWSLITARAGAAGRTITPALLINRFDPRITLQNDIYKLLASQHDDTRRFPRAIPEDVRVAEALAQGRTITALMPESPAAARIAALALWFKKRAIENAPQDTISSPEIRIS